MFFFLLVSRRQHKLRGLREQAVEEAIRLGGYQTLPLGRDRHGRFYYRFPRDSRRVFVSQPVREGEDSAPAPSPAPAALGVTGAAAGGDAGRPTAESSSPWLPQNLLPLAAPRAPAPLEQDLMVYEDDRGVASLVAWLNESGQREGPLRAALLRAFPPRPPEKRIKEEEEKEAGGGGSEAAAAGGDQGRQDVAADAASGGGAAGEGEATEGGDKAAEGQEEGGAAEAATASGGGGGKNLRRGSRRGPDDRGVLARPTRNQELPRMLAEGGVELRVAVNPPGASNNVLVPAAEAVVEFDNDGEADEVRRGEGGGQRGGGVSEG